jgi:hypothetical protein
MTFTTKHCIAVVVTLAYSLTILAPSTPTQAASISAVVSHDNITTYLATHPGGTRLNDNEISYGGGTFIVTLTRPTGTLGVPDCPVGWFCFYDGVNYAYPRGKLSDCGTQNLATWGWQYRVESAHYNLSKGSTTFLYNNTSLFQIGVNNRAIPDVAPYRNWANLVHRLC